MLTVDDMKEKTYSFSEMRLYYFLYKEEGLHDANSSEQTAQLASLRYLVKKQGISWARVVALAKHRKAFIRENLAKAA